MFHSISAVHPVAGSLYNSVSFTHEDGDKSTCVMRIRVKRNPVVFFFKVSAQVS